MEECIQQRRKEELQKTEEQTEKSHRQGKEYLETTEFQRAERCD